MKRKTKEQFIEASKKKHGDFYDYSRVEYVTQCIKVLIGCSIHGYFYQRPVCHLRSGCPKCGPQKIKNDKRISKEEFIERARKIHGRLYDYEHIEYIDLKTKIKIFCKACNDYFEQIPSDHVTNKSGCPKCAFNRIHFEKRKRNKEIFLNRVKEKYNDRFVFDINEYQNASKKMKFFCKQCNENFQQIPYNFLRSDGCGCKWNKKVLVENTEQFIRLSKDKWGDEFDYSLTEYKDVRTKIKLIHKKCGTILDQKMYNHLQTNEVSCSVCNKNHVTVSSDKLENLLKLTSMKNKFSYFLDENLKRKKQVRIKCLTCGNEFVKGIHVHLKRPICSRCNENANKKQFIELSEEMYGNQYDYSSIEYKNSYTKIKIFCNEHKVFFWQRPSHHLQGKGCWLCGREKQILSNEEIEKRIKNTFKIKYEIIELFRKSERRYIKYKCEKHGIVVQSLVSFLSGKRCKFCNTISKNEQYLFDRLKSLYPDYNISQTNIPEELFGKSTCGYNMQIDVIMEKNGYKLFIEWNGTFWHDQPTRKKHDQIKREILKDRLIQIRDDGCFNPEFVEECIQKYIIPKLEGKK